MGNWWDSGKPKGVFDDGSEGYANNNNLWINFLSVGSGRAVRFKAFLTDFSDDFASSWNEEEVYGRMDPITTFQSTKRTLTFSFDVPSSSFDEAHYNFHRLSLLTAMLYPGYSGGGANAISTAPLFKVYFSNWINAGSGTGAGGGVKQAGLVGAIKGFNFTPDLDQGVYDHPRQLVPKLFSVSCDMTVLHTHALGWEGSNWRGGGLYPWVHTYALQPDGLELPDSSVVQQNDGGASGTDEMVAAAEGDILGSTTTVEWTESGLEQQVGKEKADEIKAGMSD